VTYENPTHYCGFVISARAYEVPNKPGAWRASFEIVAEGNRYGADNVNDRPTPEDAEQNALALALRMAKGQIPIGGLPFRPRLNEDDFIAELNRRLSEHPRYEPWMRFYAHPEGASGHGVMGVARAGDAIQQQHEVYTSTAQALDATCDLCATQRPLFK
jgi:hypothetical protein